MPKRDVETTWDNIPITWENLFHTVWELFTFFVQTFSNVKTREYENVYRELDDEEKIKYMKTHNVTDDDGELIMSGFGIGLDRFYSKREYSAILNSNRKVMQGDICDAFKETHPANVCYPGINQDFSLLNKYVPGQKYEKHRDSCSFSALTFFSRGNLEGGELEFSDYDIKFECKDNSCIIFPSWVYHSATEVKGGTRYSLA